MKLKLTIGIDSEKTNPPVFMEGEAPGVFAVQEYEVEKGCSNSQMAVWAIQQEDALIRDTVKLTWSME